MNRVYIDTNVFVGAFEGSGAAPLELRRLLIRFEDFPKLAVTSELTVAELGAKSEDGKRLASGLMALRASLDLIPVSLAILLQTCDFRVAMRQRGYAIKLPDAIHCVTAQVAGCATILSADKRLVMPAAIEHVRPDQGGIARLRGLLDG